MKKGLFSSNQLETTRATKLKTLNGETTDEDDEYQQNKKTP